jgi:hypothetical protein
MAYVDYSRKDDMQDDTYNIISELIIDAIGQYRVKNVSMLYSDIDSIFLLTHKRFKKESREMIERELERLDQALYGENVANDQFIMSDILRDLRRLLKVITGELDDMGILFKMKADIDKLVMGR